MFPGNRPGDDAQVYALAEQLGLPFETRKLEFNWRFWLSGKYMGASPVSVVRDIRERTLVPPWPDLIILVGRRAVPIARWVQKQSGGRTRLVLVGHPRVREDLFDLVFTTRQYLTPSGPSVRLLPVAMSRYRERLAANGREQSWLDALPRPHHLLMLGGKTRYWHMRPERIASIAARLCERAKAAGGSLIVAKSARTPTDVVEAIESRLSETADNWRIAGDDFPRFPILLFDADILYPTADSVSMVSEAIVTGKKVGIVPVEMNRAGRRVLGDERKMDANPARDLRRFWNYVLSERLAGTMDEPLSSDLANPVIDAAREVRELLEREFGKLAA